MTPAGYYTLLEGARRTGMGVADLTPLAVTVSGELLLPESVVRDLAATQHAAGRAELEKYWNGEVAAQDRKY